MRRTKFKRSISLAVIFSLLLSLCPIPTGFTAKAAENETISVAAQEVPGEIFSASEPLARDYAGLTTTAAETGENETITMAAQGNDTSVSQPVAGGLTEAATKNAPTESVADLTQLTSAVADTGVTKIILTADITLTGTIAIVAGRTLEITSSSGNTFKITSADARHFTVGAGSTLTLRGVILDGNNAHGGIEIDSTTAKSTLTLDSAVIQNCHTPATVYGGAVYMEGSSSVMGELLITGNTLIKNNIAYWGGGLALKYTRLSAKDNAVFTDNALYQGGGGAIFLWLSPAEISGNVQFLRNGVLSQPGGAIFTYTNQPLTIKDAVYFEGNTALAGGAICAGYNTGGYSYSSTVTITGNVVFKDNIASDNGGAIYSQSTQSTINIGTDQTSNVQFTGNISQSGWGGGGIYVWYATVNIGAGTLFDGNKTNGLSGAGMYARKANINITGTPARKVIFKNGSANSCGGALCLIEGTTTSIKYADFLNNYARNFGGAIDIDSSTSANTVVIENARIDANVSGSTGGGIAVEVNSASLTIRNSIISRNSAGGYPHSFNYRTANGNGGGIYFERGTLKIYDSEITGNSSPQSGGGIGIGSAYTTLVTFLQSIEVKNTVFSSNNARSLYSMTDPAYTAIHTANINPGEGKTYSLSLGYAYNDYDISYQNDPPVTPLPAVTVTFDARGGSPVPAPVTVPIGDGIDKPATDPVLVGRTFLGWVTDTGYFWDFNTVTGNPATGAPVRKDMTLYAKYYPDTLTVTFMDGAVQIDQYQVDYGDLATPTTQPLSKTDHTFLYWADSTDTEWDFNTPITADTTLYAVWRQNGGTGELIKVDAGDPTKKLPKANFDLYDKATGTKIASYVTDSDGKITVNDLPPGDYYWLETSPPQGYTLDSTEHVFTVVSNGTATLTIENERTEVPDLLDGINHYAYIVGYTDNTVRPNANITRAEVAEIFFRLLEEDVRKASFTRTNLFSDVHLGSWYNTSISTMAKLGILMGDPNGKFRPNDSITRAEFAAIAARFDPAATAGDTPFSDVSGHWAENDIAVAASKGWIKGYPDGTFRPNQNITRAEAVSLINRVLQRIVESEADLLAQMKTWPDNMNTTMWYYLPIQEATNSHDYDIKANGYEKWKSIITTPDWSSIK